MEKIVNFCENNYNFYHNFENNIWKGKKNTKRLRAKVISLPIFMLFCKMTKKESVNKFEFGKIFPNYGKFRIQIAFNNFNSCLKMERKVRYVPNLLKV